MGDDRAAEREAMVMSQIARRGVHDERVLHAMRTVRRHRFVPSDLAALAYEDRPLPISCDQTISQPYIVAAMTEALALVPGLKVLEVGTGSGYQAAVLAAMGTRVFSIERHEVLARRAETTLAGEGWGDVSVRWGDGFEGWPEEAPFERIIVTAAPTEVPENLLEQLAPGGRMVIPVGSDVQELRVVHKDAAGRLHETSLLMVRFVPMVAGQR